MKYNSARSLYNAISKNYNSNRPKASNDRTELPAILKLVGNIKGKQVLDMGCGLGKHAKEFVKKGAIVTGYDISEKMVALAKSCCGVKANIFKGDHETVSFAENQFDIINASLSINYCKNLDPIFNNVSKWLKPDGIFTFSIPHPVWLLSRVEQMDYSRPHKIWIKIKSYDVDIFNHYHPLDEFIGLINKHKFQLINLLETTTPHSYKGVAEEKYRLPDTMVFKLQKQ